MAFKFRFFPRDEQFFDLFNQMADEIRSSAGMLEAMLSVDPPDLSARSISSRTPSTAATR